ncbi:uncharacterized protein LOC111259620 [Varroa jacobsoni]|uniref:uncharacterized protein LOC111259620 n=1 Tax=Varroa jacobsoni TaxID=62625 RepID=UPI000BF26DD3|nr:uncharacterized protein LOC111259620 [Varroa jacobsoni]
MHRRLAEEQNPNGAICFLQNLVAPIVNSHSAPFYMTPAERNKFMLRHGRLTRVYPDSSTSVVAVDKCYDDRNMDKKLKRNQFCYRSQWVTHAAYPQRSQCTKSTTPLTLCS